MIARNRAQQCLILICFGGSYVPPGQAADLQRFDFTLEPLSARIDCSYEGLCILELKRCSETLFREEPGSDLLHSSEWYHVDRMYRRYDIVYVVNPSFHACTRKGFISTIGPPKGSTQRSLSCLSIIVPNLVVMLRRAQSG